MEDFRYLLNTSKSAIGSHVHIQSEMKSVAENKKSVQSE